MVIGSSNSDLRPPASPSSPSVGVGCLVEQQGPQHCTDLSCSTRMGAGTPQGLQERGTHLCNGFAHVWVIPLGSPSLFLGKQSKPAPLQSLLCPGCPLGAGGLVLIQIISLIWVTAAEWIRPPSAAFLFPFLSSGRAGASSEPWQRCSSWRPRWVEAAGRIQARGGHEAGMREEAAGLPLPAQRHWEAPATQQNQGLGAGGKRCPLLGFTAGSWVAN